MIHLQQNKKTKKAYSLLELLISLTIIAVATVVMMNFLIVSVQVTVRSLARSFVREEISNAVLLISRDIRNSDKILNIDCDPQGSNCQIEISQNGSRYRWSKCLDNNHYRICKDKLENSGDANVFMTSSNVNIDFMDISYGYSDENNNTEINLLFTVAASHSNSNLNVANIIRQSSASTRNYEF